MNSMSSSAFRCPPRRVESLRAAEVWLLSSLRLAAYNIRLRSRACENYKQGFVAANLPACLGDALYAGLEILIVSSPEIVDVRHLGGRELAGDEERLMSLIHALQHRDEFSARRVIREWLPPSAARLVLAHFSALGEGMLLAGLRIPAPPGVISSCPMLSLAVRRLDELEHGVPSPEFPHWIN
jgi:hypothetical protein